MKGSRIRRAYAAMKGGVKRLFSRREKAPPEVQALDRVFGEKRLRPEQLREIQDKVIADLRGDDNPVVRFMAETNTKFYGVLDSLLGAEAQRAIGPADRSRIATELAQRKLHFQRLAMIPEFEKLFERKTERDFSSAKGSKLTLFLNGITSINKTVLVMDSHMRVTEFSLLNNPGMQGNFWTPISKTGNPEFGRLRTPEVLKIHNWIFENAASGNLQFTSMEIPLAIKLSKWV